MIRIRMSDVCTLVLLTGIALFIGYFMGYPKMPLSQRAICGTRISGLGKGMMILADGGYTETLPPADQWCDWLVIQHNLGLNHFVCNGSDAVDGESSYAINKNVAGLNFSQVPQDVVLLFETDFGKDPNGRNEFLKNRRWFETMPDDRSDTRVYRNRWNQSGGPEILTTEHHGGKGCNVVFGDTSVRFVETKDLPTLKWKVTETVVTPARQEAASPVDKPVD